MLGTYLSIFRRRLRLIAVVAVLLAPLAYLALTWGSAEYRSSAHLVIGTDSLAEGILGQGGGFEEPERRLATEVQIVEGRAVLERAAATLAQQGWEESPEDLAERVDAGPVGSSNAVEVVGQADDPERARQLTEALVEAYIGYRRDNAVEELRALEASLEERLADAEAQIAELDAQAPAEPGASGAAREAAVAQHREVAGWLEEVRLRLAVDPSGVELVSPPVAPEEPEQSLPLAVAAAVSVLGGLLVGCGVAFAIELLEDSVRTAEEADRVGSVPPILELPRAGGEGLWWPGPLAEPGHPTTAAARGLRHRLEGLLGATTCRRVLLVGTSADARDTMGVGAALATAYGRAGSRVLLVADGLGEADLAMPAGGSASRAAAPTPRPTRLPGVSAVPATSQGEDEPGLLDGFQLRPALDALSQEFDVIVVAAPQSSHAVEAVTIGRLVEAVLVVCALGRTRAEALRRLTEALRSGGAAIQGQVLVTPATRSAVRSDSSADRAPAFQDVR